MNTLVIKNIFCVVIVCVFFTAGVIAFTMPGAEVQASNEKVIVASTSWVAAIAEAGGARNVHILAPVDLRHPPEYELRPSDIALISKADFVLYAGWERFAQKLAETAGTNAALIKVVVDNDPEVLKTEAEKISILLGTEENFIKWKTEFDSLTQSIKAAVLKAYSNKRAVVQRMQTPFIKWLGFDIVGEYGPAEPSPALILELARLSPVVVIDNYHGPSGMPIAAAAKVPYAELINFPGKDGTVSIIDVFRYNAQALIKAAGK